jgi:hypothetical protein
MDLLAQYSDEEGEGDAGKVDRARPPLVERLTPVDVLALPSVDTAPTVDLLGMDAQINFAMNPADKRMLTNPSFAAMNKPLVGPVDVGKLPLEAKYKNHKMGHVQKAKISDLAFEKEMLSFHNYGYAANPGLGKEGEIVNTEMTTLQPGRTIWDKAVKRRRMNYDEASKAGFASEQLEQDAPAAADNKWGGFADEADVRRRVDNEVRIMEEENARQKEEEKAVEGEERETKDRVTSIFHGSKETDYKGRGWWRTRLPWRRISTTGNASCRRSGYTRGKAIRWEYSRSDGSRKQRTCCFLVAWTRQSRSGTIRTSASVCAHTWVTTRQCGMLTLRTTDENSSAARMTRTCNIGTRRLAK